MMNRMRPALELVKQTVDRGDGLLDDHNVEAILTLLENHPFAERILHLLINQQIGKTAVRNMKRISSPPNCIGTAFYVAGMSELGYPYWGYDHELSPHMRLPKKAVPGAFIFSFCAEIEDWHAGIFLGNVNGTSIAFAQVGRGGRFVIEKVFRHYANPKYYVPATIVQDQKPDG